MVLNGDVRKVKGLKKEGKGDIRTAYLANLQLVDPPTLICLLVEQGLKAETQTWGRHHNSRLK